MNIILQHPPVIVSETGSPVGRAEYRVKGADDVDERVAHQEEEVDDGGNFVHCAQHDGQEGDERGQD